MSTSKPQLELPENLPISVKKELEEAFEKWKLTKEKRLMNIDEVLDAYNTFSKLMRKHVDASWS